MKKKLTKKLSLKKEKIVSLNPDDMQGTKGGVHTPFVTVGCTFEPGCSISCSIIGQCCINN